MDVLGAKGGEGDVFCAEVVDEAAGEEASGPDPDCDFRGGFGRRHCVGKQLIIW